MADISKITVPSGTTYDIKDATARSSIPDAATATPLMDGTAAVGSSSKYAKEDHVHPKFSLATVTSDGLMSSSDKTKLDALGSGAIYSDVSQIGLTSGSCTITDVWNALPTNTMIRFPRSQITDYPVSSPGIIVVIKSGPNGDLGTIRYYSRTDSVMDYKMFIIKNSSTNNLPIPDGTWRPYAVNTNAVQKTGDTISGTLSFSTTMPIAYTGSGGTAAMIKFKDGDAYGNGIVIGGGGLTVVGGGESASTIGDTIGATNEYLCLCNDAGIDFYTNCQNGAASATHTTIDNSGNFSGGAAKWSTARTITVGNEGKSVDGTGNVSFPHPLKCGVYGSDTANTSGWYKVCTINQSGHSDHVLNLLITSTFNKQAVGLLHLHTRCNNGVPISCSTFKWLYRYGFDQDVCYWKDNGDNTWSLFVYQTNSQYGRIAIQLLSEFATGGGQYDFVLANNTTKESSAPSGGYYSLDTGLIGVQGSVVNRLTSLNQDFGNSTVAFMHATSSVSTANGKPTWGDGHVIHFGWDNKHPNWASQLYIGNGGYYAGVRYYNGNNQTWTGWEKLLFEKDGVQIRKLGSTGGAATKTFTFSNTVCGILYVFSTDTAKCGEYMLDGRVGTCHVVAIKSSSAITTNTSTANKIVVTTSSSVILSYMIVSDNTGVTIS